MFKLRIRTQRPKKKHLVSMWTTWYKVNIKNLKNLEKDLLRKKNWQIYKGYRTKLIGNGWFSQKMLLSKSETKSISPGFEGCCLYVSNNLEPININNSSRVRSTSMFQINLLIPPYDTKIVPRLVVSPEKRFFQHLIIF